MAVKMLSYKGSNATVYVNLTNEHCHASGAALTNSEIEDLGKILIDRRTIKDNQRAALDSVLRSDICFSPRVFTFLSENKIGGAFAEAMLNGTHVGRSIIEILTPLGLGDFFNNAKYRPATMHKILCIFSLSMRGQATSLDDVPKDAVKAIVNHFRTEDCLRWREDFWREDPHVRVCLKKICFAFARYYEDDWFINVSGDVRITANGNPTFAFEQARFCEIRTSLDKYYQDFVTNESGGGRGSLEMFYSVVSWLRTEFPASSIEKILAGPQPKRTFVTYVTDAQERLSDWHVARVRWAVLFSSYLCEEIELDKDVAIWVFSTETELRRIRKKLNEQRLEEGTIAKHIPNLPEKLGEILLEVLSEGESGWPATQSICWAEVSDGQKWIKIYSPVMVALFLVLFYLGCRTSQAKRFDSGEGDLRRYNPEKDIWEDNTGPLSGYWMRKYGNKDTIHRNYAYEFATYTGFYLNTNKTSAPHAVPDRCRPLHLILGQTRDFQENYNPISKPVKPKQYVDQEKKYPVDTLKRMPDIFPLFRIPPHSKSKRANLPPTTRETANFYCAAMVEVERRYNERNPSENVSLVVRNGKTGQPTRCLYPPHGLRSARATKRLESGLPVEIVSKHFMGHASVDMTMESYDRRTAEHIDAMLQPPALRDRAFERSAFQQTLRTVTMDEALIRAAHTHRTAIEVAVDPTNHPTYCDVEIGQCSLDGAACSTGGPDGGLVEGGEGNCILCKYLCSGTPWARNLHAFAELRNDQILLTNGKIDLLNREVQYALGAWNSHQISHEEYTSVMNPRAAEIRSLRQRLRRLDKEKTVAEYLLSFCKQAIEDSDEIALFTRDIDALKRGLNSGRFLRLGWLNEFGRVYTVFRDSDLESELKSYLSAIAFNNNLRPAFVVNALSADEVRKSVSQFTRSLILNLEGDHLNRIALGTEKLNETEKGRNILKMLKAKLPPPDIEMTSALKVLGGQL